jgi:2'-5' RNA ligase
MRRIVLTEEQKLKLDKGVMIAAYPSHRFVDMVRPWCSSAIVDDGIHMTILYSSGITAQQLQVLASSLRRRLARTGPFDLGVTGSGVFYGDEALVRVLLMNSPVLPEIRVICEEAMREAGCLGEQRYGHIPHVTLEYHKDFALPPGWEKVAKLPFGDMEIHELHLVIDDEVVDTIRLRGDWR